MRTWSDEELLEIAKKAKLVTTITKMDGSETFNIVAPSANTQMVLSFARRLLEAVSA